MSSREARYCDEVSQFHAAFNLMFLPRKVIPLKVRGRNRNQPWCSPGLKQGQRHPFAYLMEACDDIA